MLAALELELRRAGLGVSTALGSTLGESNGGEGQDGSGEELHFDVWLVVVVGRNVVVCKECCLSLFGLMGEEGGEREIRLADPV